MSLAIAINGYLVGSSEQYEMNLDWRKTISLRDVTNCRVPFSMVIDWFKAGLPLGVGVIRDGEPVLVGNAVIRSYTADGERLVGLSLLSIDIEGWAVEMRFAGHHVQAEANQERLAPTPASYWNAPYPRVSQPFRESADGKKETER